MKCALSFVLTAIIMVVFTACGQSPSGMGEGDLNDTGENRAAAVSQAGISFGVSSETSSTEERPEVDAYRPPADVVDLDLEAGIAKDGQMQVEIADDGLISQCYYMIDEMEVYLSYTYEDTTVQIFGFIGSIVVADESFTVKGYDPQAGYIEHDGYYFKGVVF